MKNRYLFAVVVALAACRGEQPSPAAPALVRTVKSHAAGVAAAQVLATSEAAASRLALDGEGLRLFNAVSGASRLIPFGTSRPDALRAIGAAQKGPVRSEGNNVECNARYTVWDNGLTVWFARDRFAGWSATASASAPGTAAGVKVGSTREQLESAYAATTRKSTLGHEFNAGALAGLLASGNADARITALWAGTTCIAR